MPLYLQDPRGDVQNYIVRGKYLGVAVHRSTQTRDRKVAARLLRTWQRDIESGAYEGKTQKDDFGAAALSYQNAGGTARYLVKIAEQFGRTPIRKITQAQIDAAAVALYPNASPATRNRHVYAAVSVVLRHAGVRLDLRRPKGGGGKKRNTWLEPEQAFALLDAAENLDAGFGAMCTFLLYTGCRLGEAERLRWADIDLSRALAYVRVTKNGDPRTVFLPEAVVAALANLPARDGRVFRLTWTLKRTGFHDAARAAGVQITERIAFHIFRHTYGAWMRRFGGVDTAGLVGTGAWKSRESASVYEHVDASGEARKAALLPRRA